MRTVVCAQCAQCTQQCVAVCLEVCDSAAVRVWQCGSVRQCARLCAAALNHKEIINEIIMAGIVLPQDTSHMLPLQALNDK
jgi:hypothetical protein